MASLAKRVVPLALAAAFASMALPAFAQEKVLNLYSSRHYQTDDALYANFTKQTGIKVNRIEAGEDPLIERLKNEGTASPGDVLVTVDAGRLWRAEQLGLLQPIKSATLESRLPDHLRASSRQWYGFSARARVIVYNKATVNPADVQNYEDLASPKLKGKVCTRSGSHVYNLSLMSALIEHWGERLLKSEKPEDKKAMQAVGLVWPNQKSFGTHMNVSGAGVLKSAPHRDAAIQYLEYLASDSAQSYFANGNNEWPVAKGAKLDNAALASLGNFKMDTLNISALGKNQPTAQKIFDRVGYK